jgi:hypothetical protein
VFFVEDEIVSTKLEGREKVGNIAVGQRFDCERANGSIAMELHDFIDVIELLRIR